MTALDRVERRHQEPPLPGLSAQIAEPRPALPRTRPRRRTPHKPTATPRVRAHMFDRQHKPTLPTNRRVIRLRPRVITRPATRRTPRRLPLVTRELLNRQNAPAHRTTPSA